MLVYDVYCQEGVQDSFACIGQYDTVFHKVQNINV